MRPDLPAQWVDVFRMGLVTEMAVTMFSFFHTIPGIHEKIEVVRLVTPIEHAKRMVDVMCRLLNHFPIKEEAEAKPARTKGGAM
jgi:hypothetical protein